MMPAFVSSEHQNTHQAFSASTASHSDAFRGQILNEFEVSISVPSCNSTSAVTLQDMPYHHACIHTGRATTAAAAE